MANTASEAMHLNVETKFSIETDRVKCVDLHPTEPWVVATLYTGEVHIYDYDKQELIKKIHVCSKPVRAGKFIARQQWLITGSDDCLIRVFDLHTFECIKQFEAHTNFIRSIAIHPTQPIVLTSGDDGLIHQWNWEESWSRKQTYQGHNNYVMQVTLNWNDTQTFASASLDGTIKIWRLDSPHTALTLESHEKGANCVNFYTDENSSYLLSGGDDGLVKVWDYQSKICLHTIAAHQKPVICVGMLRNLSLLLSGSEDGNVGVWDASMLNLESNLAFGFGRCWAMASLPGNSRIALGFDQAMLIIEISRQGQKQ